jgi:2-keto-4-pentenoate hydratase
MTDVDEKLVAFLEDQMLGRAPFRDVLEVAPNLSLDDAYRLQGAVMARRVSSGDRLAGYKAAYTNLEIQKLRGRSVMVGSVLQSHCLDDGPVINLGTSRVLIEPEVSVLLKKDLTGPGVTPLDAFAAIEGYLPSIELAVPVDARPKQSEQMQTATHKWHHHIILGSSVIAPHGIDLRLEGCVAWVNSVAKGSGTGVEVLGNPLNVVAVMANKLAEYGVVLKAGMILVTGTLVSKGITAGAGDDIMMEFTRLGRVSAHLRT